MMVDANSDLGEIPQHWKVAELGLVADITKLAGYEYTKHFEYTEDGEIIALRSLNVVDGQIDTTNIKRIAKSVSEALPRSKLFCKDLLLTYTGSKLGDTALIDLDGKYHLAPNVCRLRANDGGDAYFLYVFLRSKVFAALLDGYKVGSGQPTVPMKNIRKIPLPWPPKPERERIGKIFRSLNEKIELNHQTSQTLEEMAQAVFKSWFVDFDPTRAKVKAVENGQDPTRAAMASIAGKTVDQLDTISAEQIKSLTTAATLFPETLVESSLGETPEGWEVTDLKSTTSELRRGISPKYCDEGGVSVINQKCIRNHSVNFKLARLHDPIQRKVSGRQLELGDILVNSTGVGTLGRLAPVRFLEQLTVFDSHVTVVRADTSKISVSFLAGLMFEKEAFIEASGAGSTGQTELRKQVLEDIQFAKPTVDIVASFDALVVPIGQKISVLEQEQESFGTCQRL